ncbi:hypothetical protein BMW23_0444 [Bodo saltans virus]|uniref:Uncharacterized protein n=1 Tax=Bodo saltans virus TaxID=2024608 RepID=A0A2H4UUF4_9VIRU|nr:hypothetical protein QJ851_gp0433 [Bodo saltans virus]ATZ80496.1 hypothetical protein BMW23_0444 [Bodo saltans virus]
MDNYFKVCPAKMDDGHYLTDYRQADTREQYIKNINGIVRDDDYRLFLQKNAEKILDREWEITRKLQSCSTYTCFHNYPTVVNPGQLNEELNVYNAVKTNKINQSNPAYPKCAKYQDYRLTHTPKAFY